jgi:2,4-dienoyl-CoA reductase-like NADH-dependent reductase (Old Yellow Enzyme family)
MNKLDDPIQIGPLTIRNRLVKSATAESAATAGGDLTEAYLRFYARQAAGGAGLIVTGHIFVTPDGRTSRQAPLLERDDRIPAFRRLSDLVHEHSTAIFSQLNHGGREALPVNGSRPPAPSPVRNTLTLSLPRAMSGDEIEQVIGGFGAAAGRAREAGFDGIELHGAHGYLINQFLSARSNRRRDEWGGATLAERMRFLRVIYRTCRDAVGPDYPILIKINGSDYKRGGLTPADAAQIAQAMEAEGMDGFEVSGGTIESGFYGLRGEIPIRQLVRGRGPVLQVLGMLRLKRMAHRTYFKEAYNLSAAAQVKQAVHVPVIAVGGFRQRTTIEAALRAGQADMIGMARPLIREPGLPMGFLDGSRAAAACESCNLCFATPVPTGQAVRCQKRTRSQDK